MQSTGEAAMVQRSLPGTPPATYDDVLAAPENKVAELIDGELFLSPRPAGPHTIAAMRLGSEIEPQFGRSRGAPGGWIIVAEPEIHFERKRKVLVPDLAGWRRERLAAYPAGPWVELPPDWLAEVLSPSTARLDRLKKLPIYFRHAVSHVWIVDPLARTLEIFRRLEAGYTLVAVHGDDARVRAEPFDALELDLAVLWADVAQEEPPP